MRGQCSGRAGQNRPSSLSPKNRLVLRATLASQENVGSAANADGTRCGSSLVA